MSDETAKASDIQGEGNKQAAREYNQATREFVKSDKVQEAAKRAAGQDPAEGERAERAGLERAKEKDPGVHRDYSKPTKD